MDRAGYRPHEFGHVRRTIGPHGYLAFYPSPLPRRVELAPETVVVLAEAEAALGRLDGFARLMSNPRLLVRPYLVREAVASTRIEGTQASVPEVFEAGASDGPMSPDIEEVVNYITATERGLDLLTTLPISVRLVREVHAVLLNGVRGRERQPGEVRRTQNWIGPPGSTIETATYVPPPTSALGAALDDWERFVNADLPSVPLLAQCAIAHYQFEAIHPFLDGNGRVGRLLIVLFLAARGRLTEPVLYLSPYLERRRDEYVGHLQAIHERGEVDPWIAFFCAALADQANEASRRAQKLHALREDYRRRLPATGNMHKLVDVAFDSPVLTARIVEKHLGVARPTALRLLTQLATEGIVREQPAGPRSQRRWEAHEIVRTVAEDEPPDRTVR